MAFDEVIKSAVSRLGVVRVSNALNPLLYLTIFTFPICCSGAWIFRDDLIVKYTLLAAALVFPFSFLWHYTRFAYLDPNRLQSEEHLARMRELSIVERKGSHGRETLPISPEDLPVTEQESLPHDIDERRP